MWSAHSVNAWLLSIAEEYQHVVCAPKKGIPLLSKPVSLLSTLRTIAGSSPFLEQRVSLSNPISRLTWKHACPDCYSHMEIIKLFLHEKQILYFPQTMNSHCNKHRSKVLKNREGCYLQIQIAVKSCEQSMWAGWRVKHSFRQLVHKKHWKEGSGEEASKANWSF